MCSCSWVVVCVGGVHVLRSLRCKNERDIVGGYRVGANPSGKKLTACKTNLIRLLMPTCSCSSLFAVFGWGSFILATTSLLWMLLRWSCSLLCLLFLVCMTAIGTQLILMCCSILISVTASALLIFNCPCRHCLPTSSSSSILID